MKPTNESLQLSLQVARSAVIWCFVGAIVFQLLLLLLSALWPLFTGRDLSLVFYPIIERLDKADGHVDSLGWDFGVWAFFMIAGSLVGSAFGIWRGLKHRP